MSQRYIVILAGGRGERFWPQSRTRRPKQLLPIVGDSPLLAQTVARLTGLVPIENILLITNKEQLAASLEACPALLPHNVIGEPIGRDTAPAVGLAALLVRQRDPEGTFAMLPADHIVHDTSGFQSSLQVAFEAAEADDVLVTIGIHPTFPATGYGYIEKGDPVSGGRTGISVRKVRRFVEKPDINRAETFLASGNYAWNAGMFIWRARVLLDAIARFAPELRNGLSLIESNLTGCSSPVALDALLERTYPNLTKISVDYAIMEKADHVLTVESAFDWDDVGEWTALCRHYEADSQGNICRGNLVEVDSTRNIVVSMPGHTIALMGISDCVVVQTADATLICPKDRAQEVKKLVTKMGQIAECQKLL